MHAYKKKKIRNITFSEKPIKFDNLFHNLSVPIASNGKYFHASKYFVNAVKLAFKIVKFCGNTLQN